TRSPRAVLVRAGREDRKCKIGETSSSRLEPLAVLVVNPCGDTSPPTWGGAGSVRRGVISNRRDLRTCFGFANPRPQRARSSDRASFGRHINSNLPDLNCHVRVIDA